MKLIDPKTFLVFYSAIVTLAFVYTAWHGISAVHNRSPVNFDQITVHRINIVEPDGTPRMILAAKARFPGQFIRGKETARPDRNDSAGAIFINDEGTENGGLLFGGYKAKNGDFHSFGHLSFDEYGTDQTLDLEAQQDGKDRFSLFGLNDMPSQDYTVEERATRAALQSMPQGPARTQALRSFRIAHPNVGQKPHIQLIRLNRGEAALRIADAAGNNRIEIGVDAKGDPSLVFLDSNGKVTQRLPK
jgi:hypothetical protein